MTQQLKPLSFSAGSPGLSPEHCMEGYIPVPAPSFASLEVQSMKM